MKTNEDNMYHYRIREATLEDLPTLLKFEQGVVETERPFNPTLKSQDVHYYPLGELIQDQHVSVRVAEHEGKIVGSGYARIKPAKSYLRHEQFVYLGFMYVVPAYRGKGVNRAIMENLIQWGKNQGVRECRLEVYDENQSAIQAYTKLGFKKLLLEMRMEC